MPGANRFPCTGGLWIPAFAGTTVIFGDDGYFSVGFELPVVLKVKTRLPWGLCQWSPLPPGGGEVGREILRIKDGFLYGYALALVGGPLDR